MLRVPPRDAALASSLVMACVGLLPLLELGRHAPLTVPATNDPSAAASSALTSILRAAAALAPVDRVALCVSSSVAVLGLVLLAVQLQSLSVRATFRALRLAVLGVGLALSALGLTLTLSAAGGAAAAPSLWQSEAFAADERMFAARVNDLYCHAKGQQLCSEGSLADARHMLPLQQWPVGAELQPGKRVAAACDGFAKDVRQWGYPTRMELCRVCQGVEQHATLHTRDGMADPFEELLEAVDRLSSDELLWCGEYLAAAQGDDNGREPLSHSNAASSPYWNHRASFRDLLDARQPPKLGLGTRALQVLVVAAITNGVALLRWVRELELDRTVAKLVVRPASA